MLGSKAGQGRKQADRPVPPGIKSTGQASGKSHHMQWRLKSPKKHKEIQENEKNKAGRLVPANYTPILI